MKIKIAATNTRMGTRLRTLVERHLRFALTRFAPSIGEACATLSDESGPRGAATRKCQIVIRMHPRGLIVVSATAANLEAAARQGAERAGRAVSRHLDRKRYVRRNQRSKPRIDLEPLSPNGIGPTIPADHS